MTDIQKQLAEALFVLENATSFMSRKARDGHAKAVAGLKSALAAHRQQEARGPVDAPTLADSTCAWSVWWSHKRKTFTTPRQAAFAAWNESFRHTNGIKGE